MVRTVHFRTEIREHMKIFFYSSQGGHFNEAMMLIDRIVNEFPDITIITFNSPEMKGIKIKNDLLAKVPGSGGSIITALLSGVLNAPRILVNLLKERPDVAISTGSGELAIPALVMAKWFGIKTIYIETWTRVREPSTAGKVLYYFSDVFLVQWPDLLPRFGRKARYLGGLL